MAADSAPHTQPAPDHTAPDAPSTRPAAPADPRSHSLLSAVRATSLVTLASRIGGLVRDVLIARIFGASPAVGSAFAAAFAIPNMFRRLFGEGALSAAFLPEYSAALRADESRDSAAAASDAPGEAGRLASLTLAALGAFTGALTIIAELVLLALLLTLPQDAERALSFRLIMVMLPFMPLICSVAILAGMLQVHGRFGPAASGPLVLNAFIVTVGVYYVITGAEAGPVIAYALGIATVLSGATQLFWFFRLLRPHVRFTLAFSHARPRARAMLRRFVPVVIGMGTLQLNTFLDTLLAMWPIWVGSTMLGFAYQLDEASNLILSVTTRLYQFPLGVFGIAVATAAFPLLARHADDPHAFTDTLRRGLRLSLFIGLPASFGLILVRTDLTAVLFGHGDAGFNRAALHRSSAVLLGYAPAVWAYSLNHVFTRAFYARKDTRTPMALSIAAMVLNLALNLTLIWSLAEAGLAWATSIAAIIQCAALAVLARRRLCDGPLVDRETLRAAGRILIAAAAMSVCVALVALVVPAPSTWSGQCIRLLLACVTGLATYSGACMALRVPELRWLLSRRAA